MNNKESFVDLYTVLGIERTSTYDEVRKGFKQRALETHPDKLDPGCSAEEKEEAEKRFHEVYEAFEVLNDPSKRNDYDRRYDLRFGFRRNVEERWAAFGEKSIQRAKEREAWAAQAEQRYQERMRELRENAARDRAAFLQSQQSAREDAQMINKMVEALCKLDTATVKARSRARKEWSKHGKSSASHKSRSARHDPSKTKVTQGVKTDGNEVLSTQVEEVAAGDGWNVHDETNIPSTGDTCDTDPQDAEADRYERPEENQ